MKNKRYRITFDASEDVQASIRALSDRWNCKTNEAISRAVSDCLHRPFLTAPEPPWAQQIKAELQELREIIMETFS